MKVAESGYSLGCRRPSAINCLSISCQISLRWNHGDPDCAPYKQRYCRLSLACVVFALQNDHIAVCTWLFWTFQNNLEHSRLLVFIGDSKSCCYTSIRMKHFSLRSCQMPRIDERNVTVWLEHNVVRHHDANVNLTSKTGFKHVCTWWVRSGNVLSDMPF